jgi:hypothetical protein
MKLYVGNLPFKTTENDLRDLFAQHGDVASATIVMDRETGRPRGFGFVEFANDEHGRAAMAALNGKNYDGRGGDGRGGFGGGGGRGGFGGGGGGGGRGRGGW